ncbi:MAG: hypothetical protein V4813_14860 [Gemmatimonadota bacterium]
MTTLPHWLRVVALYTIGSAFVGLASLIQVALAIPSFARTLSLPVGALFFAWAVWAGTRTLQNRREGVRALYLVQVAQVVAFSIGWRLVARAGVAGQLLLASAGFRFEGGWQAHFVLTPLHDGALRAAGVSAVFGAGLGGNAAFEKATWAVGINFFALYLAVRMWHYMKTATYSNDVA